MQFYRPPLGENDPPLIVCTEDPVLGRVFIDARWFDNLMIEAGYIKVGEESVISV